MTMFRRAAWGRAQSALEHGVAAAVADREQLGFECDSGWAFAILEFPECPFGGFDRLGEVGGSGQRPDQPQGDLCPFLRIWCFGHRFAQVRD